LLGEIKKIYNVSHQRQSARAAGTLSDWTRLLCGFHR